MTGPYPLERPPGGVHDLAFSPPWLLRGRHVQTCFGTLVRRIAPPPVTERWRIPVDDDIERGGAIEPSGAIELVGEMSAARGPDRPREIAILLHGLGGSASAKYVLGIAHRLLRDGLSVVRMNLRGVEIDGRAMPGLYRSGLTEDLTRTVDFARARGFERVYVAGFSLTGNTVLKWLGEAERPGVTAFAISPPVRLAACVDLIDAPRNFIYQRYFLHKLHRTLEAKARAFPAAFASYAAQAPFRTLRAFDDHVTAPWFGFRDAAHYYDAASSVDVLPRIRDRVTIVHALDDPFVDAEDLRFLVDRRPPSMEIALPHRGGHVGFYEGPRAGYAMERWIAAAFRERDRSG